MVIIVMRLARLVREKMGDKDTAPSGHVFFLHERTEKELWETVVCKLLLSKQTPPTVLNPSPFTYSYSATMGWFHSLLTPLKRLWDRLHSTHRKRTGIYILYKDVKSCPSEDVHVLWSILVESGSVSASSPSN